MKYVYLLIDQYENVIAIYDDADLANTMKPALEQQFNLTIIIDRRSVNQDIKTIGVTK